MEGLVVWSDEEALCLLSAGASLNRDGVTEIGEMGARGGGYWDKDFLPYN